MLSRVANSVYWLGRYLERSENYARFIDVNYSLTLDLPPDSKEQWKPLITATGDIAPYTEKYDDFDRDNAIYFLAFDENNSNSLFSAISKARENARTVREKMTKESWEKLNETYLFVKEGARKEVWKREDPRDFFSDVKYQIQLLYGIEDNSVARTEEWYFRQLGQFLERADKTSRILDVKYHILLPSPEEVGSTLDILQWMALLKSVSAFNTYRRIHGNITPGGVVEFLVLNKFFPRSIFFCLSEAEKCLYKISDSSGTGFNNSAEKKIGSLRSQLEYHDVNDVITYGLHEYLDELQLKINEISNAIYENFFEIGNNIINQQMDQR
ncbi:alpha-E domain-containing protein [Aliifodinibius sp. S!AR15-10]|uniref:alpha-E domain-containing protein n=1 Tax=Aliifodinibius sp. S!AR15-10 TaxID=2950437 RepID=UPI00286789E1|nr:alpha-E domain-containing protein [Aliifodinibius sp. S!AR15-10]MDR8391632.1 alpha-E domain-containing protein [Aliifodinibius sp. S!AR15-10]